MQMHVQIFILHEQLKTKCVPLHITVADCILLRMSEELIKSKLEMYLVFLYQKNQERKINIIIWN